MSMSKPKFTWQNYLTKNIAVRCTTEEQAKQFLKLCQVNNIPCPPETFWDVYTADTCYEADEDTNESWYSEYNYYFNECYIIYNFSEIVFNSIGKTIKTVRPYKIN